MRRLKSIATMVAVVLGLLFYIAWPAYSGYEIRGALEARDPVALSRKIDFPSVRTSLRPAVTAKVESELALLFKKVGGLSLNDETRARFMPRIVDGALNAIVTPEMLIRVHEQGGNLKEAVNLVVEQRARSAEGLGSLLGGIAGGSESDAEGGLGKIGEIAGKIGLDPGKLGGLLGKPSQVPASDAQVDLAVGKPKPRLGFDNIKHFGLNGPLGLAVGVARDAGQREADLTAEMSFIDGDWKLTGLIPKL